MIEIDPLKCVACCKCIAECPTKCIMEEDGSVIKVPLSICLGCGHCASVCAYGAVDWRDTDGCRPFLLSEFKSTPSDLTGIFQRTRSVRKFKPDKPAKKIVEQLIADAEKAPSADNFRQREYIVVNSSQKISEMEMLLTGEFKKKARFMKPLVLRLLSLYSRAMARELEVVLSIVKFIMARNLEKEHPIFRDAPSVILITGPKRSLFAEEDCIAAQNYLRLSATVRGIGSCIVGFARGSNGALEKYLNIASGRKIYAATIIGFQEVEFKKQIDYPISEIRWVECP